MEINELIKENLEVIGEDYGSLKPYMKAWLTKITISILNIADKQKEAERTLKETDYSIKTISKELGASRTTMYNHGQLLKRYIEQLTAIYITSNPYKKIDILHLEKRLQQEQLSKMMMRDIDIELLKAENKVLLTYLAEKEREIKRLEKYINEGKKESNSTKIVSLHTQK